MGACRISDTQAAQTGTSSKMQATLHLGWLVWHVDRLQSSRLPLRGHTGTGNREGDLRVMEVEGQDHLGRDIGKQDHDLEGAGPKWRSVSAGTVRARF